MCPSCENSVEVMEIMSPSMPDCHDKHWTYTIQSAAAMGSTLTCSLGTTECHAKRCRKDNNGKNCFTNAYIHTTT